MYAITVFMIAWITGYLAMEAMNWAFHHFHVLRTDVARSVGTLYRHSFRDSLFPGLMIQLSMGAALTLLEITFLLYLPAHATLHFMGLEAFFGALIGLGASIGLVQLLKSETFFRQFPNRALTVAFTTIPSFIVYGVVIGLVLGLSGLKTFLAT